MSHPSNIELLFCDAALLVVNKPAGLRTLPDGYHPELPYVKSLLEGHYGRLWVVHRLDKETSGVLLLARSAESHRLLNAQFEQHRVTKVYHVLVIRNPGWQERTVTLPLRPNGDRRHRTVVDDQSGKPAVTHFKVLERFDPCCLLQAVPETGRTHQIRAHLFVLGLSILGDKLYAVKARDPSLVSGAETGHSPAFKPSLISGFGLHAWSIEINHPITGVRMNFAAPYPGEWVELLGRLRRSVPISSAGAASA